MKQQFILRGKPYNLEKEDILNAAKKLNLKAEVRKYYVEIEGKFYSIKQVVQEALNISPIDFTTQDANHILKKLGFEVKRKS